MAEATGKDKVVPKVGQEVQIVFHGYYEGEPLAGRCGYEIGTVHTVTEAVDGSYELDYDTLVLPEEIEVIQ